MKIECEMNMKNLRESLEEIGWSIKGQTNRIEVYYIKDHNDEFIENMEVWYPNTDGRIEIRKGYVFSSIFYFKDCVLEKLDNNAVSVRGKNDKNIFILFMNHNK
jgi:predicted DNA-binding protein